jgi:hypothetical protein
MYQVLHKMRENENVRLACDKFNSFLTSALDGLTHTGRMHWLCGSSKDFHNEGLDAEVIPIWNFQVVSSTLDICIWKYLFQVSAMCIGSLDGFLCSPESLSRREFPQSMVSGVSVECSLLANIFFFMFNPSFSYCDVCLYIFMYIPNL